MKDLENKNDLKENDVEKVSGGSVLHPTSPDDPEPSEGGATGSW